MSEPIYLLDHKLKWRLFNKLYAEASKNDSGPTPQNYNKVLWEMLRDKKIYIWIDDTDHDDPMHLGLELPSDRPVELIKNGPNG